MLFLVNAITGPPRSGQKHGNDCAHALILPESFEPIRRECSIPRRILNVLVFGRWHSGKFTSGTAAAAFAGRTARRTNKLPSLALSRLAVALIHRLRKLFQKFPETVRNWLWKTKIVLRL
jgi:hypothetical protein